MWIYISVTEVATKWMYHLSIFLYYIVTVNMTVTATLRMMDMPSRSFVVFVHGIRDGMTKSNLMRDRYRHDTSAFVRSVVHDSKRPFSIFKSVVHVPPWCSEKKSYQRMTRLSFSTSMNRMISPRSTNSQYASRNSDGIDHHHRHGGDDVSSSYYDSTNKYNHHRFPGRISNAVAPTTTFQYSPYPLSVCGLQLSAVPASDGHFDSEEDLDHVFEAAVEPSHSRPHPPALSDETSYGDGFGAYQYGSNDNDTSSTNFNSKEDIYDELPPPKEQPRFVPKTNMESKYATSKPIMKSTTGSAKYDSSERTSQPRSYNSKSTAKITTPIRPPVQVSIPSLSTNQDANSIQLQAPIDVDLSVYDNIFDSDDSNNNNNNNNSKVSTRLAETIPQANNDPNEKVTFTNAIIDSVTKQRPTEQESLIPTTHFHVGQSLNDLPGYDPSLDQFLSKAAYGVGTTTSIDILQEELATTEMAIYEQNNHQTFNINSPKQVSVALYGPTTGSTNYSTNKDVLEGMAGAGNRLAALILQYRSIKYKLAKFVRQEESRNKGTAVRSAMTVARPKITTATVMPPDEIGPQVKSAVPEKSTRPQPSVSETRDVMADPLLLLDASAYIFRAYHSMPPIHRPDGMPTGAVMGFCRMLNSLLLNRMLEGEQPRLVLCFDAKGKTFRHDIYEKYKANRASAPMDLVPQFDLVRQAAKAYGICQIDAQRFEADDVIATLACKAIEEGVDANIMSGDKDLMQLVTDLNATPSIQIIDPMKKERTTYQQVMEKWQVPPNKLGDLLALAGDTADNVPGVRGIGPKTAAKLINEFGNLENLLNNIDSVKQLGIREKLTEDKEKARVSRILVELNCTVPMSELTGLPDGVHQKVSDLRMEAIDPDRIIAFYDQMGFKELKRSFQNSLKGVNVKRKKSSTYNKRVKATIPTPEDYKDVPF